MPSLGCHCEFIGYHSDSDVQQSSMGCLMSALKQTYQNFEALVSDNASTDEIAERRRIKLHARRCFARRAVKILSQFRENGGALVDVLPLIWRFRRNFSRLGVVDIVSLVRPIAFIIFPESIAVGIRRVKQSCIGQLRRLLSVAPVQGARGRGSWPMGRE